MRITQLEFDVLSPTSVRVSWDRLNIPEITGYIVYYSQTGNSNEKSITKLSVNISSSDTSVTIDNLTSDVQYQFEVVAVAELNGDVVIGQRSPTSSTILLNSSLIIGNSAQSMSAGGGGLHGGDRRVAAPPT